MNTLYVSTTGLIAFLSPSPPDFNIDRDIPAKGSSSYCACPEAVRNEVESSVKIVRGLGEIDESRGSKLSATGGYR